ncbi:AAA family ATPase [Candidatus Dojkabacteria bacterium]|nr:AAA family ATPase [Candidatus Dojkabacteria bacterium]
MDKPKLIVMAGLQGSGKSTIAEEISKQLKIFILSVDPIHSSILKAGIEDSFEVGLADYLVAERLADENLARGISGIIDASNYVDKAQSMWEKLASKHGIQLKVIECKIDEDTHKHRIGRRVRQISGIKEVSWEDVLKRKVETVEWDIEKLQLDTKLPMNENTQKAINYITK